MNQEYLDSLVGMDLQEAKDKVTKDGYTAWGLPETSLSSTNVLPYALVELYFDKNNKVSKVFNQEVYDQKYVPQRFEILKGEFK